MRNWAVSGGKRLFDAALAGMGLLLFAAPLAFFSWQIRRRLGNPVFFRQERVGRGGRHFTILKFRTMMEKGEVPPGFSRWLRDTAMDELPQMLNILLGEMSFVGPRPLIPEELGELERVPGGTRRLEPRPGLAGLAQLASDKTPSLEERVRLDLEYVDRASLGMDLRILFQSVRVTLRGAWERPGPKVEPKKG